MKDRHKSPNSDSSELMSYDAQQVAAILTNFAASYGITCDITDTQKYLVSHGLAYKKVKEKLYTKKDLEYAFNAARETTHGPKYSGHNPKGTSDDYWDDTYENFNKWFSSKKK